jgi:hypothetical protein
MRLITTVLFVFAIVIAGCKEQKYIEPDKSKITTEPLTPLNLSPTKTGSMPEGETLNPNK